MVRLDVASQPPGERPCSGSARTGRPRPGYIAITIRYMERKDVTRSRRLPDLWYQEPISCVRTAISPAVPVPTADPTTPTGIGPRAAHLRQAGLSDGLMKKGRREISEALVPRIFLFRNSQRRKKCQACGSLPARSMPHVFNCDYFAADPDTNNPFWDASGRSI